MSDQTLQQLSTRDPVGDRDVHKDPNIVGPESVAGRGDCLLVGGFRMACREGVMYAISAGTQPLQALRLRTVTRHG